MSRLPAAKRDDLPPEHQKIWDHIHAARTGGGGPYSMLMHSPDMAQHFAATEDYFRNESLLPDADREIMILAAARELEARYAWCRHEIRAQKLGVDPKIIEALRAAAPIDDFTGRERLLIEFTRTRTFVRPNGERIRSRKVHRSRRTSRPLHDHRHRDPIIRRRSAGRNQNVLMRA
jgi:alkylhydroperoxidase family enzyme